MFLSIFRYKRYNNKINDRHDTLKPDFGFFKVKISKIFQKQGNKKSYTLELFDTRTNKCFGWLSMANSDTFVIKLPATHRPHTFVKAVQPQIPFRYTNPHDDFCANDHMCHLE